jgi:ABC-type multidrug transport system fused ATPase/permease subunit
MRKSSKRERRRMPAAWAGVRLLGGGNKRSIAGLAVTAMLAGFAEAGILAVVAQVGTSLVSGADAIHVSAGPISLDPTVGELLGFAAFLALVRIALLGVSAILQARLAADSQSSLRTRLFDAFSRASWGRQASDLEAHLQELVTSHVVQTTNGTRQLAALVSSFVTFVALVISALLLNVVTAVIIVAVAIASFYALRPLGSIGRHSAKDLSQAQLGFAGGVSEAVRMAEATHVFGVGAAQRGRIHALVDSARAAFVRTQFVGAFLPALYQSLIYLTLIAGLGGLYATGVGNVAALGAVILIMVRAGSYGQQVQGSYQIVLQALPFAERLVEAERIYEEARDPDGGRPLPRIEAISFENVSYSYAPGAPVLDGIDFTALSGEAIGVVGPSGAGKSTLVQLLLRLRAPDRGTYAINGVPAQEFAAEDWHRRVAYVPQEPQLLHASVADNIRYFRDLDDAAVERAAKLARIDADVRGWSRGYETTIGPRADAISGGQRQRICLARALAARPQMLVLDEPTSALDPRSELLIQESLAELAHELTLFVVTHRMTMLAVCDSVLVIVGGRVDDFGRTQVLRETNEYFRAAA